jgi:hypothetical protein
VAVLSGHADEEGVPLDQAHRPALGVHHRDRQQVGIVLEPLIDLAARRVGRGRR